MMSGTAGAGRDDAPHHNMAVRATAGVDDLLQLPPLSAQPVQPVVPAATAAGAAGHEDGRGLCAPCDDTMQADRASALDPRAPVFVPMSQSTTAGPRCPAEHDVLVCGTRAARQVGSNEQRYTYVCRVCLKHFDQLRPNRLAPGADRLTIGKCDGGQTSIHAVYVVHRSQRHPLPPPRRALASARDGATHPSIANGSCGVVATLAKFASASTTAAVSSLTTTRVGAGSSGCSIKWT